MFDRLKPCACVSLDGGIHQGGRPFARWPGGRDRERESETRQTLEPLPAKLIRLVIFRQPEFAAVAGPHNTLCRVMFVTGLIVLFDWRYSW